eukprot:CAMPEP_0175045792 /NCGR_PEP_ID=MMETSP0052_2-20121109/4648_1 /TAXON_ID=51329 ORGANISM="Polytomella parva, Strain SAG 63-3" /NCGR_SAMPLE_ID=MMETSP0052_2 /ASSEMBLY_ACC=CAM_ASM_000194 /LENGTH=226 /DNA_ID=CAMNT_0016309419 /DNA_START=87 /DNA_END=767 /DNA_ORIENTATION=+
MASTLKYPKPLVVSPIEQHKSTVIMLHGLGDSGDGWYDIGSMFQEKMKNTKFIFPTAPMRTVTANYGMNMTAWFDIKEFGSFIKQEQDEEGLLETKRYVEELISKENAAGIPSEKIVVAGFSQGGAISLLMLRSDAKLAGAVSMSGFLPLRSKPNLVSENNKKTPVLMCHGDADMVVKYEYGKMSYKILSDEGVNAEFLTYSGMPHSACQSEMNDVQDFLSKVLGC